jgi:FkbM family methyltransferase
VRPMKFIMCFALFIGAMAEVMIRPSDHVMAGAKHDFIRVAGDKEINTDDNPSIHHIKHPGDVPIDANFETNFWGVVDFKPVPKFSIDTHDPVLQDIFISGNVHYGSEQWDHAVWDALVLILQKTSMDHTPVMVDVGANLGYFSLAAAALGAHVIAFEPMSRNARKFAKSIHRNHFEGSVTLFQNIVWDDIPSFRMKLEATSFVNQGNGKTLEAAVGARGLYGVDFVSTVSLSDVLNRGIDVLKINTEGTEGAVIEGAKSLICGYKVSYIIMEFTDIKKRKGKYSALETLTFLHSIGYSISDVTPNAPPLLIPDYLNFPPNLLFTLQGPGAVCS